MGGFKTSCQTKSELSKLGNKSLVYKIPFMLSFFSWNTGILEYPCSRMMGIISSRVRSSDKANISILGHITSLVSVFPKLTIPSNMRCSSEVVSLSPVSSRA